MNIGGEAANNPLSTPAFPQQRETSSLAEPVSEMAKAEVLNKAPTSHKDSSIPEVGFEGRAGEGLSLIHI